MCAINNCKYTSGANHLADSSKTTSSILQNFSKPSWFANYTPPNNLELFHNNAVQKRTTSVLAGLPGLAKSLATTNLAIAGAQKINSLDNGGRYEN